MMLRKIEEREKTKIYWLIQQMASTVFLERPDAERTLKERSILKSENKISAFFKNIWKHRTLLFMALPTVILLAMFSYVPMGGLVVAFKDFNYADGLFRSPWNGIENFKYLFMVGDTAWRLTRNTVGYYLIFTLLGTIGNVAIAIGINEMIHKKTAKYFQTTMILPTFISYIAITFIVSAFLKSDVGIINRLRLAIGLENIRFYQKSQYWPVILTIVRIWKTIGYGSVLYLSALAGFDQEIYEAADIDGASSGQKLWRITIPMLLPTVVVMTLLGLGNIMHSDTGLFYQVTQNIGLLYPTTQVLDSYVLNALMKNVDYGLTSAATFYQSVVGFVMVMVTNWLVRRTAPEEALF